ncbi:MAG: hypothetical protein ACRDRK_21995 [Pseudonocardia sp.]
MALTCPAEAQPGPAAGLTILSGRVAVQDSAADTVQLVGTDGLSAPVALGHDVPTDAVLGDRDTGGRLPMLDSAAGRLLLVDVAGVGAGRGGAAPITVDLGPGDFGAPVMTSDAVAVLDRTSGTSSTRGAVSAATMPMPWLLGRCAGSRHAQVRPLGWRGGAGPWAATSGPLLTPGRSLILRWPGWSGRSGGDVWLLI